MAAKTLSQIVGGIGGSRGAVRLAPDLNFPKDKVDGFTLIEVTGINASGGLTTILSLTGKFIINGLLVKGLLADRINQVKLTVDGVVIWDVDPLTNAATEPYIGTSLSAHDAYIEHVVCEDSFLFEMHVGGAVLDVQYAVRPIL